MKQTILVYGMGSLGDTIVSIPSLRAIRGHFPADIIYFLHDHLRNTRVSPEAVLENSGLVDQFLIYSTPQENFNRLAGICQLWQRIKSFRFDRVIYLVPSERSLFQMIRDKLFFRLCGIKETVGFMVFKNEELYPVDAKGQLSEVRHEALFRLDRLPFRRNQDDLAKFFHLPLIQPKKEDFEAVQSWLSRHRKYPERPMIAICPGANQPAKFWCEDRFEEVGRRILEKGKYELIIVGGKAEYAMGNRLAGAWADGINAAGVFDVLKSAVLLSSCAFVITLDSGPAHLAAAVGRRVIALYACRDHPGRWNPLGYGHRILRFQVPCAGCRQAVCPVEGHPCMKNIQVDDVMAEVESMLDELKLK